MKGISLTFESGRRISNFVNFKNFLRLMNLPFFLTQDILELLKEEKIKFRDF